MTTTEYAVTAFVFAMAVFGIVDAIRTPLISRRFYRDKSFSDKGVEQLENLSDSALVAGMYTKNLYQKEESGVTIRQFKAYSTNRRKFTLSKAARKRNQTAWSITVIDTAHPLAEFTLLPTVVPEAITYITDGRNIDIPDDSQLANRYHVVTEQSDVVLPLMKQKIRKFLLQSEAIAIECTSKRIILRRHWAAHQVLERLQVELDVAMVVHDAVVLEASS